GVELAGQVGAQLLGDRGDLVGGLLRAAEQRRQGAAAAVIDAVELAHGAGAVQGDAGLGALLVRLHQDGGDDADLGAGRIDVDLAGGVGDVSELGHGWGPSLRIASAGTSSPAWEDLRPVLRGGLARLDLEDDLVGLDLGAADLEDGLEVGLLDEALVA